MDKKVTKRELVKEIRQHLAELRTPRADLNAIVSRQRLTMGGKVYNNEVKVASVTSDRITLEWYTNGERSDYSGEYPYNDVNVNYGYLVNVRGLLLRMTPKQNEQ